LSGRRNHNIDTDTVDFGFPLVSSGIDEVEMKSLRVYIYYLRVVRIIRESGRLHARSIRKSKYWALEPEYVQHNISYASWLEDLPSDLQIPLINDSSVPWIPSHHLANIHAYYYTCVIMHHRPQFLFLSELHDLRWKKYLKLCCTAAKSMCSLQEAILRDFGINGLMFFPRGIGFTVYAILTSTVVLLVHHLPVTI
jgi:hypothetical protein